MSQIFHEFVTQVLTFYFSCQTLICLASCSLCLALPLADSAAEAEAVADAEAYADADAEAEARYGAYGGYYRQSTLARAGEQLHKVKAGLRRAG